MWRPTRHRCSPSAAWLRKPYRRQHPQKQTPYPFRPPCLPTESLPRRYPPLRSGRCGFLFPHLPRRCCPARSVPARSIRSAHLEERGISEADCLYIGSGGYRGSGYRIDIASVLTHGHLHLRRTFAEKTCLDRIALLGEFRPETRSLRLFQHLYVPYPAVGPETYHYPDWAAETGSETFHRIAGHSLSHPGRIDIHRIIACRYGLHLVGGRIIERREYLCQCIRLFVQFRLSDGRLRHTVHQSDRRGGDRSDAQQHHDHIYQRTFHNCQALAFLTAPKRRGFTYLSIRGTKAFMMRMANDIPSGYCPQIRIKTVIAPIPIP